MLKLKNGGRILSLTLMLSMLMSTVVFAGEADSTRQEPSDYSNVYEDGKRVVCVHRVTENGLVKLSEEEYLASKANQKSVQREKQALKEQLDQAVIMPRFPQPYARYEESGIYYNQSRTDLRKIVSSKLANRTNNVSSLSFQVSATQSYTSNYSLSTPEFNSFKENVGVSFQKSITSSQTITANISPNHRGWIEFYPIMDNSFGVIHTGTITDNYEVIGHREKFTDIYIPKKVSGLLYGEYTTYESPL